MPIDDPVALTVTDNSSERRYEILSGGEPIGVVRYLTKPGSVVLVHTEVEPSAAGGGVRLAPRGLRARRHPRARASRRPAVPVRTRLHPEASRIHRPGHRRSCDARVSDATPHQQRGPGRVYGNDAIEVHWEPTLCIHTESCVRTLGRVFDPQARPWVDVDAADPDAIAAAVLTCPTGALHFRRTDGGAHEEPPEETTIDTRPNGPLFVRGRVKLVDGDGRTIREDTRMALCRCGGSANKPFCDASHRRIGVRTTSNASVPGAAPDQRAMKPPST